MTDGQGRGFTLIEVLVALAILALTFTFAYRAISGGLDRLFSDGQAERAVLLAQAQLARVGHDIALVDGTTDGRDPSGFSWQITVSPYGSGQGVLAGHRVVVAVAWRAGLWVRQVQLETVRLGPADNSP
jgi:prepilin-type N-terminal cleavage/methylation domain-containing protein